MRGLTAAAALLLSAAPVTGCSFMDRGGPSTGDQAFTAVRTDGNPQRLVIAYTGGACEESNSTEVETDERSVRVRLRVTSSGDRCPAIGLAHHAEVVLPRPLGDREVVDASTGSAVDVFDGAHLRTPTALPTGLEQTLDGGFSDGSSSDTWTRRWSVPDDWDCAGQSRSLEVVQGRPPFPEWDGWVPVATQLEVAGAPATASRRSEGDDLGLTWTDAGSGQQVRLTSGGTCARPPAYSLGEMVRVATSMR